MPKPKRRHSKGRTRRKREEKMQASIVDSIRCPNCKALKLPHRECKKCGK